MARADSKVADYTSWGSFEEHCRTLPPGGSITGPFPGDGWALGVNTVSAALALSEVGWPEGLAQVQAISAPALTATTLGMRQRGEPVADVTGACLDVGGYLSGVPECWVTRRKRKVGPVVTIDVNPSSSGMIPASAMVMRGAAVCALVQALHGSGVTVRLHVIEGGTFYAGPKGSQEVWQRVRLTDDNGGPLDMDRLAYVLCHPAATRVLGYTSEARLAGHSEADLMERSLHAGWPEGGRDATPPSDWTSDLYLPGMWALDANWDSPESVTAWVAKEYERLSQGLGVGRGGGEDCQ